MLALIYLCIAVVVVVVVVVYSCLFLRGNVAWRRKRQQQLGDEPRQVDFNLSSTSSELEWLKVTFRLVYGLRRLLPPSCYLWEQIYPKAADGALPTVTPSGQYAVRLFLGGVWCAVLVDDRVPVDLMGYPLLPFIVPKSAEDSEEAERKLQLWPLLLSKAVLKAMQR